jgi:ribulose-phosphate 3-epimerase
MFIEKNKFNIAPSLLSADFSCLREVINDLEKISINIAHFDVMDNHFVPNLTFGHKLIRDLRKHSNILFDTHLMIDHPEKFIDNYIKAGCNNITFHIEACNNPRNLIKYIKKANVNCGISLKPNTTIDYIKEYLPIVDLILVMTVEPGFGGQELIKSTLPKISTLKKIKNDNGYDFIIECDGGISLENVKQLRELGMDIAVMGSSFFKSKNQVTFLNKIYESIES